MVELEEGGEKRERTLELLAEEDVLLGDVREDEGSFGLVLGVGAAIEIKKRINIAFPLLEKRKGGGRTYKMVWRTCLHVVGRRDQSRRS